MITAIEAQILDWVYSATCSKIMQFPFCWRNGRLFPKLNHGSVHHICISCILLAEAVWSLVCLWERIGQRNINGSLIQALSMLRYFVHFIWRLNIWIYRTELIQVTNQSLSINFTWGIQNYFKAI